MKKKLALMFTTALATASLTACDGPGTADTGAAGSWAEGAGEEVPPGGDSEVVAAWWGNQIRSERTQTILEPYPRRNLGTAFDGRFPEQADYRGKLVTVAVGHSISDIVRMDYKHIQQYANNDLPVDLTPHIENGTTDVSDCNEDVPDSDKTGDGLYAIYDSINVPALLCNKTAPDEVGIMVKDNMTMDEFVALHREAREKTEYKTNIARNDGGNFIKYFLRASGIVMLEGGKLSGAIGDYVSHFKLYEGGIKDGWVVDPSIFAERTIGSAEQDPTMYGSNPKTMSWYASGYTNQLTAIRSAASEGVGIAITTWPLTDPVKSDYLKPSQLFAITKGSAGPDEAVKVLDFVANSVECNEIFLGERGIPLSPSAVDSTTPKIDEISQGAIKFINGVVSGNSSQIGPSAADDSGEINDLLNKLGEQICYDQMMAKDTGWQLFTEGSRVMELKKGQ